jgi:fructuronate reductase/mannitol 2-dehydrogenase
MVDYVLPSLHQARIEHRPRGLLTLVVAAWLRYLRGFDLVGRRIAVEDVRADELRALSEAGGGNPRPLLKLRDIFGDLSEDEDFRTEVERLTSVLDRHGVRGAIAAAMTRN